MREREPGMYEGENLNMCKREPGMGVSMREK